MCTPHYATESKANFLRKEMQSELGHEDRQVAAEREAAMYSQWVISVNGKVIPNIVCNGLVQAQKALATIAAKPWNAGKKVELVNYETIVPSVYPTLAMPR